MAAGAFVGIERVVERRLQEAGFTGLGPWKGLAGERLVAEHLVPGDVVCYGLCEEFVGRFSVVCTLDPLDADALRAILLEAQGSPLAEAQSFYAMHGIDLEFDDATIDAIVARALTEKAGARRVRRIVDEVLADVAIQLPELAAAGAGVVSVARDADGELMVRCLKARQRRERPTRAEQLRAERRLARGGAAPPRP